MGKLSQVYIDTLSVGIYMGSIQGVSWNGQSICHRVCVVYPGICEVSQQLSTDTLLVYKYKTNWPPGCTNTFEEGCQHKLTAGNKFAHIRIYLDLSRVTLAKTC